LGEAICVKKRDSARTRERILQAARRLFADQDIAYVGIRDIARAAGVSHGLVQRYFGTREEMVAAIVHAEVNRSAAARPSPTADGETGGLEGFRKKLRLGQSEFVDFARIVVRAELAGLDPGKMLELSQPTPAMKITETIRRLRRRPARKPPSLDPKLVSAYVNASLFAFATLSPWLMASVGLKPEDYASRLEEINEISAQFVAFAAGVESEEAPPEASSLRAAKAARSRSQKSRVKR
jgi:AcrR family transcriptional regulator